MNSRQLNWRHVIGVLGGLGPFAHIELEKLLLAATANRLARHPFDQDYPEWIVASMPSTPDRTESILGAGPSALPCLERGLRRLLGSTDHSGADFAVIACNTAHLHLDALRHAVPIPIYDVIDGTLDDVSTRFGDGACVGLLATSGTLRSSLYPQAASRHGRNLRIISPFDCGPNGEDLQERLVMEPIYGPLRDGRRAGGGIKSGMFGDHPSASGFASLRSAVKLLADAGAEVVVTACTEIPLAIGRDSIDGIPLVDPMAVAAERAIEIALGERPLPQEGSQS